MGHLKLLGRSSRRPGEASQGQVGRSTWPFVPEWPGAENCRGVLGWRGNLFHRGRKLHVVPSSDRRRERNQYLKQY